MVENRQENASASNHPLPNPCRCTANVVLGASFVACHPLHAAIAMAGFPSPATALVPGWCQCGWEIQLGDPAMVWGCAGRTGWRLKTGVAEYSLCCPPHRSIVGFMINVGLIWFMFLFFGYLWGYSGFLGDPVEQSISLNWDMHVVSLLPCATHSLFVYVCRCTSFTFIMFFSYNLFCLHCGKWFRFSSHRVVLVFW